MSENDNPVDKTPDENVPEAAPRAAPEPAAEAASHEDDASEPQMPIPPATFEYLVASFRFQAEMQLGLIHYGEEKDRPEPNLDLSRHFIDLLAVLQEKTRGNLSLEEKRMLENTVTELRFRYVQIAGKPAHS
jgi:hypothetical protein